MVPPEPENILFLSSFGSLRWGGQKSLFQLATGLHKDKYRPSVLLPTDEDFAASLREHDVDVIIHSLPPVTWFNSYRCLSSVGYLLKFIEDHHISLIHTDGPRNTFYAGVAALFKRRPVVYHIRDSARDPYDRILYRLSTRLLLVAQSLRSRFDWVVQDDKFVTIHNGVDLRIMNPPPSSLTKREPMPVERPLKIVSTGRIEPAKGQIVLIEACVRLKEAINFHLVLAGEIIDRAYAKACEDAARESGIQEHLTFAGYREDIGSILQDADIFVLPSLGEAFSRAVIEAMAMGKPVVATDVGGTKEAVQDGVTGFIVPPREPMAMAEKIFALATDESLRLTFGREARKRVEEFFTIEKNVEKTESLYAELLGGRRR